ncbi:MAG: hypothetical protein IJ660_05645 [Alphaproteobacteria bacterium]|nr:hypothetical protein [Alphaproteobacteria bacterium]
MKDESLEEKLIISEQPATELPEQEIPQTQPEEETTVEKIAKTEEVRHWVDEMFLQEQKRLAQQGIADAKSWIELMASIDKELSEHPKETVGFLAQRYGIDKSVFGNKENVVRPEVIQCLQNLEQNQKALWAALDTQSKQMRQLIISNFANAKDDEGRLLHPYFEIVKNEMFALLESGVALDYENAYEKALWINPQTREELLSKQETESLQTLAEEADKAKSASFAPKGGQEKIDFSQMTTREILEHNYKKLEG